jgi:hypothetical protein
MPFQAREHDSCQQHTSSARAAKSTDAKKEYNAQNCLQQARHHPILREESPHARRICGNCGMQRSCADCQWQLKHYGPLMHESPIKLQHHTSTSPARSRDLLDWQVTRQNLTGPHISQPANQWAARIKSLATRQTYSAFLHVPPDANTFGGGIPSPHVPHEMRLVEFLELLSHHAILPAIVSEEQAHHCFRVCTAGGTQKLSYDMFEKAMAMLCGMLQALDEPGGNAKQLTVSEEWAHSSSPAGPGISTGDVQGSRRKELALSQAQIVHRKTHTDLMCRRRGHTTSTIASRLREAFTDKQSYRTLYEDMLEENRNLAEELIIVESQLSRQQQQYRVPTDRDESERLSAALAQAKHQAQANEELLVQARNEAYTTAKTHAHELAQAHAREKAQADIASNLQAQLNEYKEALARSNESGLARHEHEGRRLSSLHDVPRERDAPERARLEIENIHLKQKLDEVSAIAAMRMRETDSAKHENHVLRSKVAALTGEQHANKV